MNCPKCASPVRPDQRFCSRCGQALLAGLTPAAPAPVAPVPAKPAPLAPGAPTPAAAVPPPLAKKSFRALDAATVGGVLTDITATDMIDASQLARYAASAVSVRRSPLPFDVPVPAIAGAGPRLACPGLPPIALVPGIRLTVGRVTACHLVIDSNLVSRQHAVVTSQGTATGTVFTIIDAGSRNGTLVNGALLAANQPWRLVSGDAVQIGNAVLRFLDGLDPV